MPSYSLYIFTRVIMRLLFIILFLLNGIFMGRAQEKYIISGNLGIPTADTLYLVVPGFSQQQLKVLGASILKDGNIEFQGSVPQPLLAYIITADRQASIPLMLENTTYTIRVGEESIIIEGGTEQTAFNEFSNLQREAAKQQQKMQLDMKKAYEDGNDMRMEALSAQEEKYMNDMQKRLEKIIETHHNTSAAAYIVLASGMQAAPEQLKALYELLGEQARNSMYGQVIAARLRELGRTAEGEIAPDFVVYSPEGKSIRLHDIKAKVKMIDFWASWCAPCRAENPNVVRVYKKFHDKGLEILGVSLDDKKEDWVKAIQQDGLPWLQGSELKGQASEVARLYNITGIPHTLLLDENNRIVAKDLRGKELTKKIEEMLNVK